MKYNLLPYNKTTKELSKIVKCDCRMTYDNKGVALVRTNPNGGYVHVAEIYANKVDIDQITKQINLYDDMAEAIARNLVAWDTSKDAKTSLLPEVYLKNKWLYNQITGEEYNFVGACQKFNIGD